MKKIHRFIITLYFSPFLLTANDNTTHIVDGSSESSYAQPHYNEIVKNDARALNQDRDSFYTLESPSFIGTYSGGGAGNGRGLHILANEDFTIASLGIHANLNDEDFLARIYSSSSSSEISDLLYSIQGNPGVSGTMGWNDLNFVEYFSFEAGNYYYLEWSPADGGEGDWCSQIDYYNDGGLPYDVGPLTMLDGVSGQYPDTFGNSYHPFLRLGLELPVLGCTDSYAQNFNQDANADDGSCTYPDNGDYVLSFDGVDDYTHLDWDENMSTYTVSLWVKANILNQNQWKSFFNTHDGSSDGWQLDCDGSNSYRMQSALGEISIAPLTLDWAHIAIVADGSSTKAYFNGELVATQSWVETDWNRIELGRNRNINNPGNYSLDQVSIWNIARTDTEVLSDMINELSGDEDGLLVYWKGDAGEGEVLYDHSGNAHHATINGASWESDTPALLLPSISVAPESLSEELYVGETSVHELTIYNEGDADLQWEAYGSFSNSSRVITNSEIFGSVFNGDSRLKLEDEIGRIIIPSPEDIFSSETIPYSGSRAQGISRINEGNRNQDLESILQDLDQNFESITDIIPQIYFFSEGITGYTIWDGGGDMYDGGNQLFTSTGIGLYYSDGQVISSDQLGDGGSYFTRKYDGLFVFVADINSNPYFEIRGNNGADNGGSVDGSVLETNINGRSFYGFVKRVYGAGDPSINHLFIVEASEGLSHDFTNYTDNDYHRINGLENSDRIYYLLYAGNGGYYIDDGYALLIMDAFLNAIDISPHWMELSESSGSISPGESSTIDLILDAADMDGGEYQGSVSIVSNDLEQPLLDIPVSLTVNVPYPHIIFDHEPLDVDLFIGDTASRDIVIGNDGLTDLNWSLSVLSTSRNLTSYTFTNCGSDGNTGPLQEDCESEYLDTSLEGVVTLNEGIQQWVVPQSGNYKIEVFGAQGGGVTNGGINAGLGSRMSGNFDLEQGEVLNILVGQMGIQESQYSGGYAGGGGGGSFITKAPHNTDESILIIAGGGGGSGTHEQGYDAIVETYNSQTGPEGQGGFEGGGYGEGNSGAGFYGNGLFGGHNGTSIAYSYINGGLGGVGYYGGGTGYGGFGGGGSDGYADGGGGGGYSGGKTGSNLYGGWGGASFNSGEEQDNQPGLNEGHGYVVITLDSPEWISTSSSSGFIPVGEYDTVKVNYSAIGLEPGDYSSTVNIYSDDPDQAEVNLNTSLSVLSEVYFADISDASILEDETLDIILESVYMDYEHSFSVYSNTNSVEVIVDNDTLSLIPAPDWTGNANIEVQLTLNNNLAATVDFDLTVIPVNDKPYASNEIHNIEEDDILEIYLDAHDGDLLNGEDDEQGLTFTAMESFMHGSFSLERNTGMLTYAPNSDYFGPDSMTYLLMDDGTTNGEYDGLTDTGFVRINILPVNDSPVIQEIEDISMDEDTELVVDVMVSDVDNDDIVLSVTSLEEEVTVYIEDNAIHIIPYFNWYGATLITLYANDNMDRAVDVQEFIVTVLPVNDPPEFGELYALVGLDMDFEIPIYVSDVDMDNLEITYDEFLEYPDWVSLNDQPYRLVGNAPIEGDFEIPLLLNDGYVTVRDTFKLESRNFHPEIISISDVPDDEGGSVYIEFERSFFDQPDVTNQFYTIFRSDTLQNDAVWVNVLNGVADGQENYIYSISTMFDSTTLGEGVTAFKVVASMNTGIFQSEIGLGYSVDNIAPETPTGLTATIVDDGISLSWNLSTAHDFQYFVLQKALTSQFLDFSEFMLLDTFYLDNDYEYNQPQYYRIMAKDHSGNSSNYSDVIEAAILALDDELLPEQYALHQNYPNPFNPVTKIRYELPENANVSIRIFDINGKVVKNINQGNQNPGKRYVLWDATNQAGESVSAGMYLYMIEAGDYISVKKMLFLK